nr:ATP-binding protein [Streptomyces sp. CB02120-2]
MSALFDTGAAESVVKGDAERDEKSSVVIASNESFEGWTKTLTAPPACAAIVDRLTFSGTIIETRPCDHQLPPEPADICCRCT